MVLTHFLLMFNSIPPENVRKPEFYRQKTRGFLTFSGTIVMEYWPEMDLSITILITLLCILSTSVFHVNLVRIDSNIIKGVTMNALYEAEGGEFVAGRKLTPPELIFAIGGIRNL